MVRGGTTPLRFGSPRCRSAPLSPSTTFIFEGRGHSLTIDSRWKVVADAGPAMAGRQRLLGRTRYEERTGAVNTVRAAAVQLRPVLYSRDGTVERAVAKIDELATRSAIRDFPGDRCSLLPILFVCAAALSDARRTNAADGTGNHRAVTGDAGDRRRRRSRRNGCLHRRERT
jgi:hypothetical protein